MQQIPMGRDGPATTPLRRARELRGWSQAATMRRFVAVVHRRGETCPDGENLRRMFSYWESGQRAVKEPAYQQAFIELFEAPAEALGFVAMAPEPVFELADRLDLFTIDSELVRLIEEQTHALRLTDRRVGTAVLRAQAEAHVGQIESLLHRSVGGDREHLAAALAEAAALAGWLALDDANVSRAWELHEEAKSAAHESGDKNVLAHVTAQQACVLLDGGQVGSAVSLVEMARSQSGRSAPRLLRAWLAATSAECLAAQGESRPSMQAMDTAETLALDGSGSGEPLDYLMMGAAHLHRWRGHCLARIADPAAVSVLQDAASPDLESVRAAIGLKTDLALALSHCGRVEDASRLADETARLASLHGSRRQRRRLRPLLGLLEREKVQQPHEGS